MKKTFRTILAGAVALLAVSCYDDSAIKDELVKLDERVTAIEATLNAEVGGISNLVSRLAAAEEALKTANSSIASANSQITGILTRLDAIDGATDGKIKNLETAIKALQDADKTFATSAALAEAVAKIAVVKVEEKDGNVVLTLANGETVSLSKPLSNVVNTGLVTVVDGNWAVVETDGTVKSLEVPVGHPDVNIEFVVAENGELMYSVNDGELQSTGVSTLEMTGQEYLITDVKESEDGKIVAISIGDTTYYLPLYNPVPAVQIKSGKQFFAAGETKEIPVAIENVNNLLVMNQPYGWRASVKGTNLIVTAPADANADADKEGVVVLHGDANGACMTAVLNVVLGQGLKLSVSDNGTVTVTNPIVVTTTNWFGDEMTGFVDFAIGFVETSIFESFATPGEFYTAMLNDYEGNYGAATYANNVGLNVEYVEDVVTVSEASVTLSELGAFCWPPVEVVKGQSYVVWALPQFSDNPDPTEMVYVYYEPVEVEIEETISFNEISFDMTLYGAQVAYVGAVSESDLLMTGAPDFKTYMEVGYGYGGPWAQFTQGGYFEALGMPVSSGDAVSVAELVYGCTPSTKYYVYVVPVLDGKSPAEYVFEKDCRVFEFTTSSLAEGAEEAELTFNEEKTDFSSITVDVTVPEGTTAYAKFYEVGAIADMTDAQLIADILGMGSTTLETSGSAKASYLSDNYSMMLVVLTVTEDGKYAIAKGTYSTKKFNIVDTITVTPESIVKGEDGKYTAVFAVTGATKVVVYYNYSASYSNFNKYLMQKSTTFFYADVVDGKATVTGLPKSGTANDNYFLVYSAFNEDATGAVTEFAKSAGVQISTLLK